MNDALMVKQEYEMRVIKSPAKTKLVFLFVILVSDKNAQKSRFVCMKTGLSVEKTVTRFVSKCFLIFLPTVDLQNSSQDNKNPIETSNLILQFF